MRSTAVLEPKAGVRNGAARMMYFARLIGLQLAIILLAACQGTGADGKAAKATIASGLPPLDSGTIAAARAASQTPNPRVLVIFTHPESFLDIRDRYVPTEEGRNEILNIFREYLAKRAVPYLPEGYALYVNFINIKLAGVFPVGAIGNLSRRTVLDSTPPMLMFAWAVTDPSGKIVKSAWEKLEEDNFKDLYESAEPGDPYRYEKAVLDDWMRNSLSI